MPVGFSLNVTYGLKPQVSSIKIATIYGQSIFQLWVTIPQGQHHVLLSPVRQRSHLDEWPTMNTTCCNNFFFFIPFRRRYLRLQNSPVLNPKKMHGGTYSVIYNIFLNDFFINESLWDPCSLRVNVCSSQEQSTWVSCLPHHWRLSSNQQYHFVQVQCTCMHVIITNRKPYLPIYEAQCCLSEPIYLTVRNIKLSV